MCVKCWSEHPENSLRALSPFGVELEIRSKTSSRALLSFLGEAPRGCCGHGDARDDRRQHGQSLSLYIYIYILCVYVSLSIYFLLYLSLSIYLSLSLYVYISLSLYIYIYIYTCIHRTPSGRLPAAGPPHPRSHRPAETFPNPLRAMVFLKFSEAAFKPI